MMIRQGEPAMHRQARPCHIECPVMGLDYRRVFRRGGQTMGIERLGHDRVAIAYFSTDSWLPMVL